MFTSKFQPTMAKPPINSDLSRLQMLVTQQDPKSALITKIELKDEDAAVFTISSPLLNQKDAAKLALAKNLWKLWASIHSPGQPDTSRIELISPEGDRVARSNLQGGSMIKLETK
ncbi:MAG TPA: hypothetical protein V6D29_19820 [Leptolyngbyaceae cyanobacterium]